jgi:hypothetical protein
MIHLRGVFTHLLRALFIASTNGRSPMGSLRVVEQMRAPGGRLPRLDPLAVHLVDLLEREATRLGDEEVDEKEAEDKHAGEDEQDEGSDVVRDAR